MSPLFWNENIKKSHHLYAFFTFASYNIQEKNSFVHDDAYTEFLEVYNTKFEIQHIHEIQELFIVFFLEINDR